jgi:hypothetical protein
MHVEFKTDRRAIVDYSIVLLVEVDDSWRRCGYTTALMARTSCTDTASRPARDPARPSTTVLLEKVCEPRSKRLSAGTKR